MRYDRTQAAQLTGLSPVTLSNYTRPGATSLIRGTDFYVQRRLLPCGQRRFLFFTECGMDRLIRRDYRVFRRGRYGRWKRLESAESSGALSQTSELRKKTPERSDADYSRQERKMRLAESALIAARAMLANPCANPDCECVIHQYFPRGDVVADLLSDRPSRYYDERKSPKR